MVKHSNPNAAASQYRVPNTPQTPSSAIVGLTGVLDYIATWKLTTPRHPVTSRRPTRQGKSFKKCVCGLMANSNRQFKCKKCGVATKWSEPIRTYKRKPSSKKKRKKKPTMASLVAEVQRLKKEQRVQRVKRSLAMCV
ncbi:hypothetical protein N9A45_01820 [bacterium]|nr:hypothetical protein [bacterium]